MKIEVGLCSVCGDYSEVTDVFKGQLICRECFNRIAEVVKIESRSEATMYLLDEVAITEYDGTEVQCHHCKGTQFGRTSSKGLFICRSCNSVVRYDGEVDDSE
jgi:ribosomal protein L37AE/L43A